METYTHVYISGWSGVPQRFWYRDFLTEDEAKDLEKDGKPKYGVFRELNDKDKELLKELLEKEIQKY